MATKEYYRLHPKHTTKVELWERKRAERECVSKGESLKESENFAMVRGHAYESGVASMFEKYSGKQVIKSSAGEYILINDIRPYAQASPDRTYWIDEDGKRNDDNKGYLECKTTRLPVDAENPPLMWQFQLQWVMGVGGFKEGYLAWDCLTNYEGFGYKRYDFDQEIFDAMLMVADDYWNRCILGGEMPSVVTVGDMLKANPHSVKGECVSADEETLSLYHKLKEVKSQIKELESTKTEIEVAMKSLFGSAETLMYGEDIIATWKSSSSKSFDADRFKKDHAELYEEYLTEKSPQRRFMIR